MKWLDMRPWPGSSPGSTCQLECRFEETLTVAPPRPFAYLPKASTTAAKRASLACVTGVSIAFTLFMTRATPTGETRRGRTHPDSTRRAGPLPAGTEMEVRVGDVMRRVAAADGGQLRVDLARDFGLTYFDDPQSMPVTVGPDTDRTVVSILIHPNEWTTRCVRTNAAADVVADPADPATVLGRVEANATYPLRSDANPNWFEVEYGGATGWVRRTAGRACWEVRGL